MSTIICPVNDKCGMSEYRYCSALRDILSLLDSNRGEEKQQNPIFWLMSRTNDRLFQYVMDKPDALDILAQRAFGLNSSDVAYLNRLVFPRDVEKIKMVLSYAKERHTNDDDDVEMIKKSNDNTEAA